MSLNYIPRVTQLDAGQLDDELAELFKQQLLEATKYFEPGTISPVLPELELLLRSLLFKYSIYEKKSTFGQTMLSLKYNEKHFSRSKICWYFGYTVGLKYFRDRLIYSFTTNIKIQRILHLLEQFQLIGDVINFVRFIQNGKSPMLIDFLLNLEITADKISREDLTDFSWTRELLWHNFIELFGTLLSLANMLSIRRKIDSLVRFSWWRSQSRHAMSSQSPVLDASTVCPVCSCRPILPHTMGCQHVFCHYCVQANRLVDKNYCCPQCNYSNNEVTKIVL